MGTKSKPSRGNSDGSVSVRVDAQTKAQLEELVERLGRNAKQQAILAKIVAHFVDLPDEEKGRILVDNPFAKPSSSKGGAQRPRLSAG